MFKMKNGCRAITDQRREKTSYSHGFSKITSARRIQNRTRNTQNNEKNHLTRNCGGSLGEAATMYEHFLQLLSQLRERTAWIKCIAHFYRTTCLSRTRNPFLYAIYVARRFIRTSVEFCRKEARFPYRITQGWKKETEKKEEN